MDAFRSNLELKDAGPKGKGVFSKVTIAAGIPVFEVKGDIISREDLSSHSPDNIKNFFQIGENTFISLSGDLDDFINHSCNPNCGLKIVGNRAIIVSLYQINPGDELTWDYSTTSTDTHDSWKMSCNCGDYNCRKVISGFHHLTDSQKQYYKDLGIVPSYLK